MTLMNSPLNTRHYTLVQGFCLFWLFLMEDKGLIVKNWLRLTTDGKISPHLREAYLDSFKDSPWATHIKKGVEESRICWNLGISQHSGSTHIHQKSATKTSRSVHTGMAKWTKEHNKLNGKLRLYKLFKRNLAPEPYLALPSYLRIPISKLRTSAHALRIETGRYAFAVTNTCWPKNMLVLQ